MKSFIKYRSFLIDFLGGLSLFSFIHIVNFLMTWGFWDPNAVSYRTSITCFARYDFGIPIEFLTWWSPTNLQFSFENFSVDLLVILFIILAFGIIFKAVLAKQDFEDYKLR